MSNTPVIGAPYLAENQASADVTHNDSLNYMEMMIKRVIVDRDLTAPPGSPAEGACYLVKATGTSDWSSHDGEIAAYYSGWIFVVPWSGLEIFVVDEAIPIRYNGSTWANLSAS